MPTSDIKKGPLYVDSTNNSVGIGTTTNNQSSSTASVTLNAASGMSAYELRNADVFSGYVGNTGTNMYLVNAKNGSLGLYTNNTERMHLTSTGSVGIGTASPKTRLQSSAGGVLNAPSLGSSSTNAPLYLTNNDTAYGLVVGNNSADGHVWLQAQRTDGTATAYNITLNEAGGNVGIGTAVLNNPLHVALTPNTASKTSGSAFDGGAVRLEGSLDATDAETAILVGNNDSLSAGIGFARENSATWGTQLRFYNHSPSITTTDELTERMRIDGSGRVTMPYQSAWHLQPSWTTNTTPSTNSIIPFGVYGNNGTFATSVTVSSGRVTVPVSGKYWIASTIRQENSQTDYQISLRKNGTQLIRSGIWYSSQAYENLHLMGMVSLAANDYLEVDINSSNMPPFAGNNDTLTFFSGYLVG